MKNISKLALAVTLMLGNVEFQSSQMDFYEDDNDFFQVSSVLKSGWGWGINKAHADDCTGEESEVRECEEDIEVIDVHGTYDDDSDFMWNTGNDDSNNDQASRNDNAGGSDEPLTTEERLEQLEEAIIEQECVREAAELMAPCLKDPVDNLNLAFGVCNLLAGVITTVNQWAGIGTAAACYYAYNFDMDEINNDCRSNVQEAMESCY